MAAYQGELMGKYVRNTEAKITRCQKKKVVMQNEIAAIIKTTQALQTTVTNLSAKNEKLQQTTAKAKQEKKQTEDRLKELKSDLTAFKSAYNPRNVKRREETKQRQISDLRRRIDKKSEDLKNLSEQLKIKEAVTAEKDRKIQMLQKAVTTEVEGEENKKV